MNRSLRTHFTLRVLFVFGMLMLAIAAMASTDAGEGDIKGVVFDKEMKEPLVGARVRVVGTSLGAVTNVDGVFVLKNVPEGAITLEVSYISFETQKIEDIEIKKGEVKTLEIQLVSDDRVLDEVVVLAKASRASEIQLLKDQRTLVVATQAIGANELSRKGIGNAEAAVAQVSGVSKQEGVKNVFVRGLSDRYNATYLNGFPIPSDDPEYKNIALEMFDTDMIQSVGVQKAFSATQGGDVGGAIIDIKSQELFGESLLEVGASGGANSSALGNTFYKQDGTGYFGNTRSEQPNVEQKNVYPFLNKLQPSVLKTPINHGFNIAAGKKLILGDGRFPLALYMVANHSKGYSHSERTSRSLAPIGGLAAEMKGPDSSISTRQMLLGNATLGIDYKHELRYNLLLVHSNNEYVNMLTGMDKEKNQEEDNEHRIRSYRQQANENILLVNQLDSDWKLADRLLLNAGVSYNLIDAKEPDRRTNFLKGEPIGDDERWSLLMDTNKRFYSSLKEHDVNVKTKLNWTLSETLSLSAGYTGRFTDHKFEAVEYDHKGPIDASIMESDFDSMDWDQKFFNEQNMKTDTKPYGFEVRKGTNYWYSSNKFIHNGFLEAVWQVSPSFLIQGGLRVDYAQMDVEYRQDDALMNDNKINQLYWLPSLNLKYDVNEKHALRLSFSKSYTLPQVKEISPYQYVNIGFTSQGNENLKPTELWNIDLKWDWYLSPSELLAVTLFYKDITNPIARVNEYNSANVLKYMNPAEKAEVAGIELELRKSLLNQEAASGLYHKLSLGLSGSYIYSNINLGIDEDSKRNVALEGSSPWLFNTDLTYTINKDEQSYSIAILASYFSDRIHTYGSAGIAGKGIKYDAIEKGMLKLDAVASAKLTEHFSLKFKANNLLNQAYKRTQKENNSVNGDQPIVISEYYKGTSFSLGAKWTF
ncbi:TonB-dependent receptor [Porphyromonadaceae bacterium W3.11]|nr:TonB-dependent receptor [Porphyromonadaceae bacterium W3.11]